MYQTDMYEGMIAETVMMAGAGGDLINAYYARPLGAGPFPTMVLVHHAPGWDEWYREATRNLELVTRSLLPKARQALEVARSGYRSGRVDFINLLDAERSLLEFQLAEVEARTRRELVLAEVSLLIVGVPPSGAPILTTTIQSPPVTQPASDKK